MAKGDFFALGSIKYPTFTSRNKVPWLLSSCDYSGDWLLSHEGSIFKSAFAGTFTPVDMKFICRFIIINDLTPSLKGDNVRFHI